MQVLRRNRNLTAKGLTFLSMALLLAVSRHVHVSGVASFTDIPDGDRTLRQSGSRRSLVPTSRKAGNVKHCLEHVSLRPPEVSPDRGAMGDIKTILADWSHISDYVQSCEFESQQLTRNPGNRSQGIVIPSAGHAMFAHTWVVVTILRDTLGCSLPIEIVYNGQEELDATIGEHLKAMTGVTLLDASLVALPPHQRPMNWTQDLGMTKYAHATGYSFKVYALVHVTTFDDVLMLDSDNLPLQNPEGLFSSPQYLTNGNSFWPDWWQRSRTEPIPYLLDVDPFAYNTFGLPAPWEIGADPMTATESGMLMLDRVRHADVLEFIWMLNSHPEVTYNWMHGDKDTYRLAFHLANKSAHFAQVTAAPAQALDASSKHAPFYKHTGMVQHDWDGNMAFLHRTSAAKFKPGAPTWLHVHYITSPLTHKNAVSMSNGWHLGQLNMEFEKYCCGLTDFEAHKLASVREEFLASQSGCSIHKCDIPQTPEGLPIMAFPPEIAFGKINATEVLSQMERLYTVMQQAEQDEDHGFVASPTRSGVEAGGKVRDGIKQT
ncbi:hypothetical protein ABBQ32_003064 [Trebouxia sp. C0010 RCD-2024]